MGSAKTGGVLAVLGVPVAIVAFVLSLVLFAGGNSGAQTDACLSASGSTQLKTIQVDPEAVPDGPIAGYGPDQLVNAALILKAGSDLGLGVRAQTIGIMTAMGESGLRVLDYGDAAGPDSRGLFQQRANGAWGSYQDRMDPYTSATNFFQALKDLEGRNGLAPTLVAHRVQRNADPYHYVDYWDAAVQVVQALAGEDIPVQAGNGGTVCSTGTLDQPVPPNADGWVAPAEGPLTSPYGPRPSIITPAGPTVPFHFGMDLAAGGCGGTIRAAADGVVTRIFQDGGGGWRLEVDHGGGIATRYVHMYASGILVQVGQHVTAGEQIARTGASGYADGCHLHFEVWKDGEITDPSAFLNSVGISY